MCKFLNPILECSEKPTIYSIFQFLDLLMCLNDCEELNFMPVTLRKMEKSKTNDCPLCLEPLDVDDKLFFPCQCGYQICRFCWHRIRTNENGLCPACRKIYQECPATYNPLTPDEQQKLKLLKKMKDQQKKHKIAENRKQLGNIRVIQKNLVFAVGLPLELSQDNEKKEKVLQMFRQFGTTLKEAITDRTTYAGSLGPSACVYITYQKPEEAVRAVKSLTNTKIEGRTIKVSLGTTKYCSNFLKSIQCPKAECLYLHELAEEEASFTKDDIHAGKHLEYEQKLIEQTLQNISLNKAHSPNSETNRTNQNIDSGSESSDEVVQNGSFYSSSEALELSPSSNSQKENRSIESNLNLLSEQNYPSIQSANSDSRSNPNNTVNFMFRSDQQFNVNSHSSNSSIQNAPQNHVNTALGNQMQQSNVNSVSQPIYVHSPIFENALKNRDVNSVPQQPSPCESPLLRIISSSMSDSNESKNAFSNIINYKQETSQSEPRRHEDNLDSNNSFPNSLKAEPSQSESTRREDDPDLEFDPCEYSLSELGKMVISEKLEKLEKLQKARLQHEMLNTSPLSSKSVVFPMQQNNTAAIYRNIYPQAQKIVRDPPPGFTNTHSQNVMQKSVYDSGNTFVNKTPSVPLHNQLGIRTNYPSVQRLQHTQQSGMSLNVSTPSFVEYSPQMSREVPDIIPQMFHHPNQRFIQSPMNVAQVQTPHIEQRSTAIWNNATQQQWRPLENTVFNQSSPDNRVANDFLRAQQQQQQQQQQLRSNDFARLWQQMNGATNNLPSYPESQTPLNSELAKMQTHEMLYKPFEASQRNNGLGHRLQYTKKL